MKLPNFPFAGLIASLLLPMGASAAVTYIEVSDAGQTLATAQSVPGGVSIITGNVAGRSADLFKFNWGGGAFYVNSVGTTAFDSQLFLFNSTGVGVLGNDDGIAFAGPAYLQTAALAAGEYFLAISGYDYDPYSAAGLIFQSSPFGPIYGPNNTSPLSSWSGGNSGGNYRISFQQITSNGTPVGNSTPVGVPDGGMTLVLMGMALGGVAWVRRKLN